MSDIPSPTVSSVESAPAPAVEQSTPPSGESSQSSPSLTPNDVGTLENFFGANPIDEALELFSNGQPPLESDSQASGIETHKDLVKGEAPEGEDVETSDRDSEVSSEEALVEESDEKSPEDSESEDGKESKEMGKEFILTLQQIKIMGKINEIVTGFRDMKMRDPNKLASMSKELDTLAGKLEKTLDVANHPERAQQLEGLLQVMGGATAEDVLAYQEKGESVNLPKAFQNILERFTHGEAKLDFQKSVPALQKEVASYILKKQFTIADIVVLKDGFEKSAGTLQEKKALARIILELVGVVLLAGVSDSLKDAGIV